MPLLEEDRAVYIHIPFCQHICAYCDFCKMYYTKKWVDNYLDKLEQEIKERYRQDKIKTIYIGGGTPSCLSIDQLGRLFSIINLFNVSKLKEFTIECNIEDITEEKLMLFKKNNINRLSIGIESFNSKILDGLNRNNCNNIEDKIILAKKYFLNINVDLIYGFNSQSIEDLENDLEKFIKLDLPHISIYGLIKEEHTLLDVNKYQELDDDTFRDMYELINKTLKNHNYIHYEISNYAREGYESIHNLTYWNNDEYYGFGLGASGFVNNIRYDNTRSLSNYLAGNYVLNETLMSQSENMENEMILGLRKIEGVSNNKFKIRYDKNISDVFDTSKLEITKNGYKLKEQEVYVSNSILIDFLLY